MKLAVIKLDASKAGSVDVSDLVFGIEDIRSDILSRVVNWQLAKRRAGTHKVQTRNENSRTGKKMYKQKGSGGARHGSRRAPQFVGGSRAFGPVVRSHAFDLPKKVSWDQKQLAEIAERIVASGEKVEGYLDIKLSVSESRYTNWPPALQQQFAAARTVDSGKPAFTLSLDSEH